MTCQTSLLLNAKVKRRVNMPEYYDMNKNLICAGDLISISGGDPELVYDCGEDNLGVNASNEAYLKAHPEAEREYYALSNFCMDDILIVEKSGN